MKKKITLVVLLSLALIATTVVGTLAFLTSDTERVDNTFTLGNVKITLDENKVKRADKTDTSGYKYVNDGTTRVQAGEYKRLMPGDKVMKDPTIHVDQNSEDCYLFMELTVNQAKLAILATALDVQYVNATDFGRTELINVLEALTNNTFDENWYPMALKKDETTGNITYYFRYQTEKSAGDDVPFFTEVQLPGTLNNTQLQALFGEDLSGSLDMSFFGRAIQAENLTLAQAFNALYTDQTGMGTYDK